MSRPMPYRIAIWLGWTKAALIAIIALGMLVASGKDPAGQAMAAGMFGFALVYGLVFVAPGLFLAHKGRALGWSFALLLLPDVLLLLAASFL